MPSDIPTPEVIAFASRQDFLSLPDVIPHPYIAGGVATVTAVGIWAGMEIHKRSIEKNTPPVFPGAAALEEAIEQTRGDVPGRNVKHRYQRLSPLIWTTIGLGIAGTGYASGAEKVNENSSRNAQIVGVVDASTTMDRTKDIEGKTRFQAVMDAIRGNDDYRGRASIIEFARQPNTRVAMSSDWRDNIGDTGKPEVDTNGGDLAGAMEIALQQLPVTRKPGEATIRRGAVMIVSDGTISSTPGEMSIIVSDPANKNVKFRVIVPGTDGGTYTLPGTAPEKSGVKPQTFEGFGAKKVAKADTENELRDAVRSAMREAGTTREVESWKPPLVWGLGIAAIGFARIVRRSLTNTNQGYQRKQGN